MEFHAETQSKELPAILDEFKSKFNDNRRAKKLVKRWNRVIVLDPVNNDTMFGLNIVDQVLDAHHVLSIGLLMNY